MDTGVQWDVDFFTEETLGLETVIKYDSVCWKGPAYVWGDPESPFYDTVKLKSCAKEDWQGWISEASNKPITPEDARNRFIWRRLIDTRGDTSLPNPEDFFSMYSNDSAYIPIWDVSVEDGGGVIGWREILQFLLAQFRRVPDFDVFEPGAFQ